MPAVDELEFAALVPADLSLSMGGALGPQAAVGAAEQTNKPGVVFGPALEQIGAEHRREGKAEEERDGEGNSDGVREGREHLAFHALQGHERNEHKDDDGDAEERGRRDFLHGREDELNFLTSRERLFAVVAGVAEAGKDVFDDDDGLPGSTRDTA